MSEPERRHIVSALAFELGKVETVAVRRRVLGHLALVDEELRSGVEAALGMEGQADAVVPARQPIDLEPSPSLSLVRKAPRTIAGRKVAVFVTEGCDRALLDELRAAVEKARAKLAVVAPRIGGVRAKDWEPIAADHALSAAPSCLFDAVAVLASAQGVERLLAEASAVDWIRDAFGHLKVIGYTAEAEPLLVKAHVEKDVGIVLLGQHQGVAAFIEAARGHRIWAREPTLRSPG